MKIAFTDFYGLPQKFSTSWFNILPEQSDDVLSQSLYIVRKNMSTLDKLEDRYVIVPVAIVDAPEPTLRLVLFKSRHFDCPPQFNTPFVSKVVNMKLSELVLLISRYRHIDSIPVRFACPIRITPNALYIGGYSHLPIVHKSGVENDSLTALFVGTYLDDVTCEDNIIVCKSDGSVIKIAKSQFINVLKSGVSFTNLDTSSLQLKKQKCTVSRGADMTDVISVFGADNYDTVTSTLTINISKYSNLIVIPEGVKSIEIKGTNNSAAPVSHIVIPSTALKIHFDLTDTKNLREIIVKENPIFVKNLELLRSGDTSFLDNAMEYRISGSLYSLDNCTLRFSTPIVGRHVYSSVTIRHSANVNVISRSWTGYSGLVTGRNCTWTVSENVKDGVVYA